MFTDIMKRERSNQTESARVKQHNDRLRGSSEYQRGIDKADGAKERVRRMR